MKGIFQIGDFRFQVVWTERINMPENFKKFELQVEYGMVQEKEKEKEEQLPEFFYRIEVADHLPLPEGDIAAHRSDLTAYWNGELESRLIGVKGQKEPYACYQEISDTRVLITFLKNRISETNIDPIFTSLFALERRLIRKGYMILHCAYVEYRGQAILFSAPSETGKTTQANLWGKYRGSRTVNGDRALLSRRDGCWLAGGWPVCGTSQICENESFPVRAVVMLSQADENHVEKLSPGQAFPLLYSQITVNKWNQTDHIHAMDLIEKLLEEVPVFHLGCTISLEAVECLEKAFEKL